MRRVSGRALAAVLAVLAVAAVGALGATALSGSAPDRVPATPAGATDGGTILVAGPGAVDADSPAGQSPAGDSPAARLACTNGTSEAVVACGYNPGPTAVELGDQRTLGGNLTVQAVELNASGFVAVHRVSFVDGAFTSSVVGVSDPLSAGLHRNVEVPLTESFRKGGARKLIAVAYRDSDGDGAFEFASSNGAVDRPFTVTYSPEGGNATDEAGDVIGDVATVSVTEFVTAMSAGPPTNLDADPQLEDLNGDGRGNVADVLVYNRIRDTAIVRTNPRLFDFDGDGTAGTKSDAEALFDDVD